MVSATEGAPIGCLVYRSLEKSYAHSKELAEGE